MDTITRTRIPRVRTTADFHARIALVQAIRDMGIDPLYVDLARTARVYARTRCVTLANVPATLTQSGLHDDDLVLR